MNLAFTVIFTAELAVNLFCNWLRPFLTNVWSLSDTIVVVSSLLSTVLSSSSSQMVRILRALRVIRIFGRVKSLKKIVAALSAAVLPVLNVFLILFLLISIGENPLPRYGSPGSRSRRDIKPQGRHLWLPRGGNCWCMASPSSSFGGVRPAVHESCVLRQRLTSCQQCRRRIQHKNLPPPSLVVKSLCRCALLSM